MRRHLVEVYWVSDFKQKPPEQLPDFIGQMKHEDEISEGKMYKEQKTFQLDMQSSVNFSNFNGGAPRAKLKYFNVQF